MNSLVADLINPLIGLVTGGIDFSNLFINLSGTEYTSLKAAKDAGAPVFAYGAFITAVINFLIIAWVVFLLVKAVNKARDAAIKKAPAAPVAPPGPTEVDLLKDILATLQK